MIKEQSFEWLLEGCHRIADVAVAYYPNYAYACSAVKALRRSIAEHACLLKDLTDQGYTARTAHLTPVQIGILLSYWGDARPREGYDREKIRIFWSLKKYAKIENVFLIHSDYFSILLYRVVEDEVKPSLATLCISLIFSRF